MCWDFQICNEKNLFSPSLPTCRKKKKKKKWIEKERGADRKYCAN